MTSDQITADVLSRRGFMRTAGTGLLVAAVPAVAQLAPPNQESPDSRPPPRTDAKVGYAVVGLGKLAIEEILPAFGLCRRSKVVALVSGHREKAEKLATHYGVEPKSIYSYDDFDKIADNPAIQAVFIALPNHMHAEFTIRGLKAKKHVLCEKPMAATSEEARRMVAAAKENDRKLMIAYRLHYEPHHLKAIELARDEQKVGRPLAFYAHNGQNTEAPNIRLSKETAGGPVGDVGVYCFNAARYILGEEPTEVFATAIRPNEPRFKEVDAVVTWHMRFPSGAIADCGCSFNTPDTRWFRLLGTKGVIEMENAFGYFGQQLKLKGEEGTTQFTVRPENHFQAEMDHFSRCVAENEEPRTPGEEGVQDMVIQEAILKSAAEGRPVKIEGPLSKPADSYVVKPTTQAARVEKVQSGE
jgi:predicted dehydrogenase